MEAIPFILFILVWVLLYKYLVNKKQKGKILSHIYSFIAATIVMFISIIPLAPPVASIQSVQVEEVKNDIKNENIQFKVLSVSDYSFTLKNKQAVSIVIGKNNTNHIDITIHRENIKNGFNLNTKEKTEDRKLISATASWDKKQFFDNKNSFVVLDIVNLDYKNKIAILDIEVSLNEARDNPTNLNIKLTANIEGELFDKLTDKTLIKKEVIQKKKVNKTHFKEVSRLDFKEKWPFKNDIAIIKCYQDEVAKMPVVIVGGRSYGLTGYADARYGQDDLKALNKVWLKNPKIEGTMIDLGPITKEAFKLCD